MKVFGPGIKMNWKYAFGEVLLIVAGVSLALAAGSWYEARLDRIDERLFIVRLHDDITLANELTSRLRTRRMGVLQSLIGASDVLYGRTGRTALDDAECFSVSASSWFNINISDLPSLSELVSTGRMAIIQDAGLRIALVRVRQVKGTLSLLVSQLESNTIDLARHYPGLITRMTYMDADSGEVRIRAQCDSEKMRADQEFMSDLAVNVDQYDVYIRDGLAPWFQQFDNVHKLVDESLGIQHEQ